MKRFTLMRTIALLQISRIHSLSPTQCLNDQLFKFDYDATFLTCEQIGEEERRRIKLCQVEKVRQSCPQSCGICCENDPTYIFQTEYSSDQNCKWLGKHDIRSFLYCDENNHNGRKVSDACPKACNACKLYVDNNIPEYVLDLTLPPSIPATSPPSLTPSPTVATCMDEETFRFQGKKRSCEKIRKNEYKRKTMCLEDEVRNSCPYTCGLCCVDDDSYSFPSLNLQKEHNCSFLKDSESMQLKYCNRYKYGRMVRNYCQSSCQNCMPRVSIPKMEEKKKENEDDDTIGSATLQERSVTKTKVSGYLALSIIFFVIGLLLAMYGSYSFLQRKKVTTQRKHSNMSISEPEESFSDGTLTDIENSASVMESSFVAATVTDLGKETSQANVHKCSNFPCSNCAKGNGVVFVKAPRTNVERGANGEIDFVPVPVKYIGQDYTQLDSMSVSLFDHSEVSATSSVAGSEMKNENLTEIVREHVRESVIPKEISNTKPTHHIDDNFGSKSQDTKSCSSLLFNDEGY